MTDAPENPFAEFVTELADGKKWALLRAEGWDDFVERLTKVIADLEPRRRQALVMLLFALVDHQVSPDEVQEWLDDHDTETETGLHQMITWLRQFRPRPDEELPYE